MGKRKLVNLTIFRQFGQVNVSGIKNFSDCKTLENVLKSLFEIQEIG